MIRTAEEFKNFILHQKGYNHCFSISTDLDFTHRLADFFELPDNSGVNLRKIWRQICYRINKYIEQDDSIKKGRIRHCNGFGRYNGERLHVCYWIEESKEK